VQIEKKEPMSIVPTFGSDEYVSFGAFFDRITINNKGRSTTVVDCGLCQFFPFWEIGRASCRERV
jgi:hypothetical protein